MDKAVDKKIRETLEKVKIQSMSCAIETVLKIILIIIKDGKNKGLSSSKILKEIEAFAQKGIPKRKEIKKQ